MSLTLRRGLKKPSEFVGPVKPSMTIYEHVMEFERMARECFLPEPGLFSYNYGTNSTHPEMFFFAGYERDLIAGAWKFYCHVNKIDPSRCKPL